MSHRARASSLSSESLEATLCVDLAARVRSAFEPGQAVARAQAQFQRRAGQLEMAEAVAHTIERGGALVVEAGTGVGKTFAYLVPALLSGERILLSTATKTLQDQLFFRDLPQLVRALRLPLRVALLKGRASYLCLHRLAQARSALGQGGAGLQTLADVEGWARQTRSGDLSELPGLDERSPVIPLVTSTRENCLGNGCPSFSACHVNRARRDALAADVVVVNHHLFFADLAVRESGVAELLPSVRVAIFDEAHRLNEIGVQFLGQQLSTGQLRDLGRDIQAVAARLAPGLQDWRSIAGAIDSAWRSLGQAAAATQAGARLRWQDEAPEGLSVPAWRAALGSLRGACALAAAALGLVEEISPELARLQARAAALVERIDRFAGPCGSGAVRWVDVGLQLRMIESPLDIAEAVRTRLLGTAGPSTTEAGGRAWIFTSATLGDDDALRWFTEPCGLMQAKVLRVGSPFDYAHQAALYVPQSFAAAGDSSHSAQVARLVAEAAGRLGGRTLVLTTTLRALRTIGEALIAGGARGLDVLVQGQQPKSRLLARFSQGGASGSRGCILVASASFWEGVDVPGEALQLVVIDKLPFPPPDDPLVEARSARLKQQGRNPFTAQALPETAVALRQGAGRLIRHESDRGLLVVCDSRLTTMPYGRRLLAALPPMRRLADEAAFVAALDALTRTSTRDPGGS